MGAHAYRRNPTIPPQEGINVNAAFRLLLVMFAVLVADAFAADPSASKPGELSPSHPSSVTPREPVAKTPAGKSVKKILVDDTLTDAQLKQILAKGYRPDSQVPGHEVSYCRGEQLSGERFVTKVCKTGEQILEDEQRGRDLINSVERIGLQSGR
jgi:hypothetical protein